MNVLFVSPEAVPFAKTGGLGDVAGTLPGALKKLGVDIRIVLPLYRMVKDGNFNLMPVLEGLNVPLGKEWLSANVFETVNDDGVQVYFIDREDLYDRPNLYGNASGDYYDNLERFSFFSHAVLRIAWAISFHPDIIHCNDWQCGLIPALLRGPYKNISFFHGTSTVFTIHNLGYQGLFSHEKLPLTGLSYQSFFHSEGLEFWGNISLLKAGIVYSDIITTVSPTYAKEIQSPDYGMGMEGILHFRRERLHGILNGIDKSLWDPDRDPYLPANYSIKKMDGKIICKKSLIKEMGLDEYLINKPILGMVSRMDKQKGFDLLIDSIDEILKLDVGIVIIGSGEDEIHKAIENAGRRYPGKIGFRVGFEEAMAHLIIAGADILLIPSRYEPCGLTQMYALNYGTIPVVRATGGLLDTVEAFDPETGKGNGFMFYSYEADQFLSAIKEAVRWFQDTKTWRRIQENGMKVDFSWDRSARAYIDLYRSILN